MLNVALKMTGTQAGLECTTRPLVLSNRRMVEMRDSVCLGGLGGGGLRSVFFRPGPWVLRVEEYDAPKVLRITEFLDIVHHSVFCKLEIIPFLEPDMCPF
jgi:hypothetical protein